MSMKKFLGLKIVLAKWEKQKYLPLYIANNFIIQKADINGIQCLSLSPRDELPNLAALKKQIKQINEIESLPIFIQLDNLSNFRKENLLENNIPFILADKMAFLPFMATLLTNDQYQNNAIIEKLTMSAQLLLIWILYQGGKDFFVSDALDTLKFSNMTLTQAYRQLVATGKFSERKKGRKIYLSIDCTKQELFEDMKSYLRNPIVNTGYMMKSKVTKEMVYSGETALSHYSFINPPKIPVYAIHKSKIENIELQNELFLNEEQAIIEVWDYDPAIFSNNPRYVDPLSLIITLLNVNDERLDMEIDNLLLEIFDNTKKKTYDQ